MAQIDFKRIRAEDFDEKYRDIIDKLAYTYNRFGDEIKNLFNGNISFSETQRKIKTFQVLVDANNSPQARLELNVGRKINGITVINAVNTTNNSVYVTSCPFISYTQTGNNIVITNISGLVPNNKYTLTVVLE